METGSLYGAVTETASSREQQSERLSYALPSGQNCDFFGELVYSDLQLTGRKPNPHRKPHEPNNPSSLDLMYADNWDF